MSEKTQEQTLIKQEKAQLQKKLLDAAAAQPQQTGKIVNAYGQEEVGIPKWQQKAAAVRQMYASCSTDADVGHQQRILQQLEAKKRARAQSGDERIKGLASSSVGHISSSLSSAPPGEQEEVRVKRTKLHESSSDSDSSSNSSGKDRKKDKKKKKEKKKKHKKDKKKSKKSSKDKDK